MIILNYIFIGLLLLVAIVFAVFPLVVERVIAPRKQTLAKGDAYECGVKTYGETWVRFRIQYYIYAIMFVIFDIETVFLFPWAASYARLGTFALVEMVIFLLILLVGLIYAWAKGRVTVGLNGSRPRLAQARFGRGASRHRRGCR